MTIDCSLIYQFNTWKQQAQNMGRTCSAQKLFFVIVLTSKTIFVQNMFSKCSELVVFMYWIGKSMNNLLSYCGLVDPRISASDKDLPVKKIWKKFQDASAKKLKRQNWERPQNFAKSSPNFWQQYIQSKVRWRFRKFFWPSQNTVKSRVLTCVTN